MSEDRFERLEESADLPAEVKTAIEGLDRFDHLEIGEFPSSPQIPRPSIPDGLPIEERVLCSHCGQPNEKERNECWACHRSLGSAPPGPCPPAANPQDITLVLDGATYMSGDPNLPEDVRVLIDRIRKEGYSPQLVADWRNWRATRNTQHPVMQSFAPKKASGRSVFGDVSEGDRSGPEKDVNVFQGQKVSVIRIDGKAYTSDDPNLAPEVKQIFQYLDAHGLTPALMGYLRQFGKKVKYRPNTTANPSDGDIEFWKAVSIDDWASQRQAEEEAQPQESTLEQMLEPFKNLAIAALIVLAFVVFQLLTR